MLHTISSSLLRIRLGGIRVAYIHTSNLAVGQVVFHQAKSEDRSPA